MIETLLSPKARRYLYGIALCVMPLLVFYGILAEAAAPLWVALAGAVLVPTLALANVPKSDQ